LRLDAVQQAEKQTGQENSALQLEDGTPLQLAIPNWMHPLPGFDSTED